MYRLGDSPVDERGRRLWATKTAGISGWSAQTFPGQPKVKGDGTIVWQRVLLPRVASSSSSASAAPVSPGVGRPPAFAKVARTLRFRSVDQLFELYLNGRVIYRMGDPGRPDGFITAGTTLHLVDLGRDFSNQPLYFRVYSRSANRGLNGRVFLGARSDHLAEIIRQESHRVVFSIVFVLIGLMLLSAYVSRGIDPAYPYFALFLIAMGAWTISQTEIKQLFLDRPVFWRFADLTGLFLLPVGILGFHEKVFSVGYLGLIRHARRFHIIYACAGLGLIGAMLLPVETVLLPFQAILAGELALLMGYSAVVAYQGARHARVFFAVLLLTVILGLHDILVALGWLPWSRPLSFWSVFALVVSCGVILGHRYFDMQARLLKNEERPREPEQSPQAPAVASAATPRVSAPSLLPPPVAPPSLESPPLPESSAAQAPLQPVLESPRDSKTAEEIAPRESERMMGELQSHYNLTAKEARVCLEVRAGLPREEIALLLGIKPSTLKIHLKSIYSKTIEKHASSSARNRDKLQRLTVFRHKLNAGD